MAYLKALEKNLAGVLKLLKQPEDSRRALVQTLQNTAITLDPSKPIYAAVANIGGLSEEDAGEIADALIALYTGRAARSEHSTADFVNDVIQTIEESSETIEEDLREMMRQQLTHILDVEAMVISAKAAGIMFEHDRLFAQGKVFSDLRPVFGTNVDDTPKTAIILHNLAIHYYQDGRHKEFFVVMDTEEVESLIKTLERAKGKAETLKAMLAAANVPYIEAE